MSKSDEQIKAFLSDEKRVARLANDGEFMDKVAGGTATAKSYSDEFEKFSLELSDEESKKVRQTTTELLSMPIEKLADFSLARVSGGGKGQKGEPDDGIPDDGIIGEELACGSTTSGPCEGPFAVGDGASGMRRFIGGSLIAGAGLLGALGCSVAGLVCQRNASKAMMQGDAVKSAKYSKAAKGLAIAASSCAGGGIAGFGVGAFGWYKLMK